MMCKKTPVLLFSIWVLLSVEAFSQTLWEIDKNKDGIEVYTRLEKGSAFKSFKAMMSVDASTAQIIEILKNADKYTEWYGYTKTSLLLKQEKDVQYNYVETKFPWPYSNRDMVYKMSIHTPDSDVIKIFLEGLPNYVSEKKGIVRMKKAVGYILLQPLDGHTTVTYVFHSEPGDHIPVWLANQSIAELPFKTLQGLRAMLKEENAIR